MECAESPVEPAVKKKWMPIGRRITPENAKEMSAKAVERRRILRENRRKPPITTAIHPDQIPDYPKEQRDSARAMMKRIEDLFWQEKDPASLDRLCSAWSRLRVGEREADGRPLPGSRKPGADKPDRVTFTPQE